MDNEARRIEDLAGEACGLLAQVEAGARDPVILSGLDYLGSMLAVLARATHDPAATQTACHIAEDIEQFLAALDHGALLQRGAA